jgi:hypothetical protein
METTMPAFVKNQEVTYLQNWDSKGTVRIIDLIVYSCGRKQMVLVDATGKKFEGCLFQPTEEQIQYGRVVPRLSPEAALTAALELGATIVALERASMENSIARAGKSETHNYTKSMREEIAKLHEPRAVIAQSRFKS